MNKAQRKESGQTALRLLATKPLFCSICGETSHVEVEGGLLHCSICNSKNIIVKKVNTRGATQCN